MNIEQINEFFDGKRQALIAENAKALQEIKLPAALEHSWFYTPLMEAERMEMQQLLDKPEIKDNDNIDAFKLEIVFRAKSKSGKREFEEEAEILLVVNKMKLWSVAEIHRMGNELGKIDKASASLGTDNLKTGSDQTDTNSTSAP